MNAIAQWTATKHLHTCRKDWEQAVYIRTTFQGRFEVKNGELWTVGDVQKLLGRYQNLLVTRLDRAS